MLELIDRHALLKKVYEHPQERERMTDGEWCRKCIYEAQKVEAVRHGQWILCKDQYNVDNDNGNYAYYCSCCNHQDVHAESAKVSFCWNCGADMREGVKCDESS